VSVRRVVALATLVVCWRAPNAAAQDGSPKPELRVDLLGAAPYSVQVGAGLNTALGYYTRLEIDAGAGALKRGGAIVGSERVDAIMRLMLDPFGESRWALSVGGGISARYDAAGRVRPYLASLLDLEGPKMGRYRLAYQAGLGGGVRLGVVIRRARDAGR
jgi:hypothetical protein